MTRGHCIDYWHKWKREGNFCGLRKQDAEINDTYLSFVEKISGTGTNLDSDFVFDHFTAGAARPLIRCKDDDIKTKALNYVVACLKRGEDVTGGDLESTINTFQGKPKKESTHLRVEEPSVPMEKPTASGLNRVPTALTPAIVKDSLTAQEPVFKTGNEIRQGLMAPAREPSTDPKVAAQELKERRIRLAEELLECYSETFQTAAREYIRSNPSWKNGAADFFYFGGDALLNPKPKLDIAPLGRRA